jgi:hypothetical protein
MINANTISVVSGKSVVGRLDQHRYRLRTRLGSFSAGRSGGSRTRRTCRPGRAARALPVHHRASHPDAASEFYERYREPVVSEGFAEVESRCPSGALSEFAEEAKHRLLALIVTRQRVVANDVCADVVSENLTQDLQVSALGGLEVGVQKYFVWV